MTRQDAYPGLVLTTIVSVVVALMVALLIFRLGFSMLRMLATPALEPPPAGELRKVKIGYRCSICGSEVRMTIAAEEEPEPPRHCMTEMDLVLEPE